MHCIHLLSFSLVTKFQTLQGRARAGNKNLNGILVEINSLKVIIQSTSSRDLFGELIEI